MIETLFIALLLCNFFIVKLYLRNVHPRDGYVGPIFFVLPFYVLNYPVRSIVLFFASGSSWEWQADQMGHRFQREEILFALAYATLFMGMLVGHYAFLCRRRRPRFRPEASLPSGLSGPYRRAIFFCLFAAYAILFIYKFYSGELTSLYESIDDLKRPFLSIY